MISRKEKPLSSEEFFRKIPPGSFKGLNFLGHWMKGFAGEIYRSSPVGLKFQLEHQELDQELLRIVRTNSLETIRTDRYYRKLVYEGYLIMHEDYGVRTDDLIR